MITILLLSLFMARVQETITKFNQKARWNGLGAIPSIRNKTADAPMSYRVLASWVKADRWYQAFMFVLIFAALAAVYLAWGMTVTLITCVMLCATFWYDYWDVWPELVGFSLALVSLPLAIVGVIVHGLSRETAPLVGVAYALHSGDWLGGALVSLIGVAALLFVRKVQGRHPLYCDRWMWRKNWAMLKEKNPKVLISLLLCALALGGAWGRMDGPIVPVLIGAGWVMAKGDETRVFTAVLPYAAYFLKGLL